MDQQQIQDKLTQVRTSMQIENQRGALADHSKIADLQAQEQALNAQLDQLQAEQEQAAKLQIQQEHEERVTQVTNDVFTELDNLEVSNGLRLRDITIDEALYQSAIIAIKGMVQAKFDDLSKQIAELQTENADVTSRLQKATTDLQTTTNALNQEKLDHTYTQQARDNAAALLEEANQQITQLQAQVKAATAGVKTTNTEDEQRIKAENDAKIKRERTIYNKVADDPINTKSYVAKLALTGESITIPYYAIKSYIEINESEVPQFRQDNGVTETTTPATDNAGTNQATQPVPDSVTPPEASFPVIPTAQVPGVPDAVDQGQQSGNVPAQENGPVTREELEALTKRVVELEKICNVNEEESAA